MKTSQQAVDVEENAEYQPSRPVAIASVAVYLGLFWALVLGVNWSVVFGLAMGLAHYMLWLPIMVLGSLILAGMYLINKGVFTTSKPWTEKLAINTVVSFFCLIILTILLGGMDKVRIEHGTIVAKYEYDLRMYLNANETTSYAMTMTGKSCSMMVQEYIDIRMEKNLLVVNGVKNKEHLMDACKVFYNNVEIKLG